MLEQALIEKVYQLFLRACSRRGFDGAASPAPMRQATTAVNPITFIPARLGSTRLPGKALALISGKPMIAHVLARGMEADLGPVVVATDAREIVEAVEAAGGQAIMTAGAHACGLDRIGEALGRIDPARKYDVVVDLQGDQPFLPSGAIGAAAALLSDRRVDMATLATLALPGEEDDRDVVNRSYSPYHTVLYRILCCCRIGEFISRR